MSAKSNSRGLVKIEDCIYQRPSGRFAVDVSVENRKRKKTFDTLELARAWRDEVKRVRPKRVYVTKPKAPKIVKPPLLFRKRRRDMGPELRAVYDARKAFIEAAPRTEVERDGRRWTVVHLPPTAGRIA